MAGPLYENWASGNMLDGVEGSPDADPDNDFIPNAVEFVISSAPNPLQADYNSAGLLPKVSTDANYLIIVYRRADISVAEANPRIQYSTNLQLWSNAVHGTAGVIVTVENNAFGLDVMGSGIDRVTVKIPRSLGGSGPLFARLAVNVS